MRGIAIWYASVVQCCASAVPKMRNKKMCDITIWHASVVQCCASFVPKIRDKKDAWYSNMVR